MSDDWTKAVDAWKAESKAADVSRARGEPEAMPPVAAAEPPLEPIDYDAPGDPSAIVTSLDGTFLSVSPSPSPRAAGVSPTLDAFDRQASSTRPGDAAEVSGLAQLASSFASRR